MYKKNIILTLVVIAIIYSIRCSNKQTSHLRVENLEYDSNGYKIVWIDDFNNATLDTTKWNIEENGDGGGNHELQYYKKENVTIEVEPSSKKSCLVLTARKERYLGKQATSGRINTKNKFTWKYGKIEAKIKVPKTANGLWPAFWMMGHDYDQVGWPRCGEIDILEMGHSDGIKNNTTERHIVGAAHWGGGWPNCSYANNYDNEYNLQDNFHLYTLIWNEKIISMYVDLDKYPDGLPYYTMNIEDKTDGNSPGNYFHKNNFILFNLAVGGLFTNINKIEDVTALGKGEAKMYIDYVKVYQKE